MAKRKQKRASSRSNSETDANKTRDLIDLPSDITADIMSRLSTKSLMRFKSLNKPWRSVIERLVSDEVFTANHHRRAESRPSFILYHLVETHDRATLISDIVETESDIRCVVKSIHTNQIQSSMLYHCNGIACFTSHPKPSRIHGQTLTLFNPAIHEYSTTFRPKPVERDVSRDRTIIAMGFGSDSGLTSFKFVRIMKNMISAIMTAQVCDISDSSDDVDCSWREIEFPSLGNERNYEFCLEAVYAKGYCYWLFKHPLIFLCFEVAGESFRVIDLPEEFVAAQKFRSSTSLVPHERTVYMVYYVPEKPVDFWVLMKDEKDCFFLWIKRARITFPPFSRPLFCVWGSHKLLISTDVGNDVATYDFLSKEFKTLVLDEYVGLVYYFSPFVDSLASLNWMTKKLAR